MPTAVGAANASRGLEVAVANLQEYCNGKLERTWHFSVLLVASFLLFISHFAYLFQNWRTDCWLGLMLRHRDENYPLWRNVLKFWPRLEFS